MLDEGQRTTDIEPEPSATFEREGAAVLNQPMHITWNGGSLALSNAAGSIALQRQP